MQTQAVLFDLLTALLDSWSVWNRAAGSPDAGQRWRAEYLRLTYGCGAYVPYEELVARAARNTAMRADAPAALEAHWSELSPWSGANEMLHTLQPKYKLAVVTNCSQRLGEIAAGLLDVRWDAVITAEQAGFYKPHRRPYDMALQALNVSPQHAVFVAGSGYDLFGTAAVGLRTYWHNRIGLKPPPGAPLAAIERRTLDDLPAWLNTGE